MLNYAKTGTSLFFRVLAVLIELLDMMTAADSSTSPFTQDELVAILDLINSLKGTFYKSNSSSILLTVIEDDKRIADPYSIWIIGATILCYLMKWYSYHMKHD